MQGGGALGFPPPPDMLFPPEIFQRINFFKLHYKGIIALQPLSTCSCRAALFSSSEKKELFGLVAFPFFLFIEKSFHVDYSTWSVASLVV